MAAATPMLCSTITEIGVVLAAVGVDVRFAVVAAAAVVGVGSVLLAVATVAVAAAAVMNLDAC